MPQNSRSPRVDEGAHEPTDAELIERTCAGDATAFDALVRRHYRAAFSVALAQTAHRADAEDACHDAFIKAAERLEDCREPERFIHWLCTIVRNRARNVMARGRVRRASTLSHETAASAANPARDAELSELRNRLTRARSVLPPIQREVVLLHDVDGWQHDAIAEVIGTSSGMSRQHLFKARKRLREALRELDSGDHRHG